MFQLVSSKKLSHVVVVQKQHHLKATLQCYNMKHYNSNYGSQVSNNITIVIKLWLDLIFNTLSGISL